MTNRKNHNSIVFLATLGVYFGIVLVGATHVLAHAAMTRNFDIQDEIEVTDDLDKKPDDERSSLSESIEVYFQDVEYFLTSLRSLSRKGKFDLVRDTFEVRQSTLLPCVAGNKVGSYTATSFIAENALLRPTLASFGKLLTDGYSLADCLQNDRFPGQEVTDSSFTFRLDSSGFYVEVVVKKQSSLIASESLASIDQTHAVFNSKEREILLKAVSENTSFKACKSQMFVITRLPRAGLESLLAKDAK